MFCVLCVTLLGVGLTYELFGISRNIVWTMKSVHILWRVYLFEAQIGWMLVAPDCGHCVPLVWG